MKAHPVLVSFLIAYVVYDILIAGMMFSKNQYLIDSYTKEVTSMSGFFILIFAIFIGWFIHQSL